MITNLWQHLQHLCSCSSQSELKQFTPLKEPKERFEQFFSPWELLSQDTCVKQAHSGKSKWGRNEKSARASLCCSESRSAAAWGAHRALRVALQDSACLMETELTPLTHGCDVLHRPCTHLGTGVGRLSPLPVLGASGRGVPTLLELQHRWSRCQEDSFPAIPVAHRPAPPWLPVSGCQQKCATAWNFSCGWHKNHKHVTVPPGFIPGLCHLCSSR